MLYSLPYFFKRWNSFIIYANKYTIKTIAVSFIYPTVVKSLQLIGKVSFSKISDKGLKN